MNREEPSLNEASISAGRTEQSPMRMGIIFFLISEAFLFGSLFWTYYYLRNSSTVWPPAGVQLDTLLASINTFILLSSSGVIWWAGRSIRQGSKNGLVWGITITLILGITFLGITIFEWTHANFRPWTNAYGSIFYTLTGFHAFHVFGGVLLLSSLLSRTLKNRITHTNFRAIDIGSLYWHYVDFIWIFVFSTLFIIR